MNADEREAMILKHNQTLYGLHPEDPESIVNKLTAINKWFSEYKGKSTLLSNIKDAIITSGIAFYLFKEFIIK